MIIGVWLASLAVTFVSLAAQDRIRLGLVTEMPPEVRPHLIEAFQRETERIVALPEIEPLWRTFEQSAGREVFDRLIVIRVAGSCSTSEIGDIDLRRPLGVTYVSDGRILPFIEIDCPRILAVLRRNRMIDNPHLADGIIGRALARVACHEIYHVLSKRPDHDKRGLSKGELSYNDLYGYDACYAPESINRIRAGLAGKSPDRAFTAAAKERETAPGVRKIQ